jgi:hypothetical protein
MSEQTATPLDRPEARAGALTLVRAPLQPEESTPGPAAAAARHTSPAPLQAYAAELESALGRPWLAEILGAAPGQIEALVSGRRVAAWLEERIELLWPMLRPAERLEPA